VLSGGGVHEPGCREPDASLRSALQAALPRAQRRAEGPFLFRSCFFTLPGLVVFQCQFCTFRVRSRPGAHAFSGFWQAETDTDEVYAQIMLMPEPEVASSQLGTTLFSRRVSGKFFLGARRVLTCCRACLFARAAKRCGCREDELWVCCATEASGQVILQDAHRLRHQHTRRLLCPAPPR
jgi:hypothetical protein